MEPHARNLKQAGTGSDLSKKMLASHTNGSVRAGLAVSGIAMSQLPGV